MITLRRAGEQRCNGMIQHWQWVELTQKRGSMTRQDAGQGMNVTVEKSRPRGHRQQWYSALVTAANSKPLSEATAIFVSFRHCFHIVEQSCAL